MNLLNNIQEWNELESQENMERQAPKTEKTRSTALPEGMLDTGGLMLALESRLMYDGSGLLSALVSGDHDAPQQDLHQDPSPVADHCPGIGSAEAMGSDPAIREVVFVDAAVPDATFFVGKFAAHTEVVILDPDQNAVEQITRELSNHNNLSAIHLIAHGSPGQIDLTGSPLSMTTLNDYAPELSHWSAAMAPGADFMIYGCDVGATPQGQALLQDLATLTGTDVAASTDLTGPVAKGGDWNLESSCGSIETTSLGERGSIDAYGYVLAPPSVTGAGNLPVLEGAGPSALTPALLVTDPDSAQLASAQVVITGSYVNGEDVLAFIDTGNITGNWNPATGTLTLTGNDTVAAYQAALRSVTYQNLGGDSPTGGVRTIAVTVNDGGVNSAPNPGSITVTPVNDPSAVTAGANWTYTESDPATVVDPGLTVTDLDNTTLTGATVSITANYRNGKDVLSFTPVGAITGVWNAATGTLTLSGADTVANYQTALRSVTYQNTSDDPNLAAGTATLSRTISFRANDGSGLSAASTATVVVQPANDAPVLTVTNPYLASITRAVTVDPVANTGVTVGSFLAGTVADADATGVLTGIAIHQKNNGRGPGWEYSVDGGATWATFGVVNNSNALLLRSTDLVRYVSDGTDDDSATFDFYAWDQTAGTAGTKVSATTRGGETGFSPLDSQATIQVNAAPTVVPIAPVMPTITEDQTATGGRTVSSIVGASISDIDGGAVEGIAVYAAATDTGRWQYSTNGGGSWSNMGAVSPTQARLLRSNDLVRFVPDAKNPPNLPSAQAQFSYYAWDRTLYTQGALANVTVRGNATPFSLVGDTATQAVTAINDAPTLTAIAPSLPAITHGDTTNTGTDMATLVGASIADVDLTPAPVQGVAVTAVANAGGGGFWEYSLDGGTTWSAVGAVSNAASLLLRATDRIRYQPDTLPGTGQASITYRAWDQTGATAGAEGSKVNTTANGGTTPFSVATDSADIQINYAPVLTPYNPALTTITEDQTASAGNTVTSLIGASITDQDAGAAKGIALYATTGNNGTWQYNTGGGWINVGAVAGNNALLLRSTDQIRFVPDAMNPPTVAATVSYYAWDQALHVAGAKVNATTRGGATPFSLAGDTASLTVTAVNDAPVLAPIAPTLTTINENATANAGQLVSSILGASVSDVDYGAVEGIAITGLNSGNGTWQYNTGTGWTDVGAVSATSALLLRSTDSVRFVPDGQNATTGTLTYRAWDQSSGAAGSKVDASTITGGVTAFSASTDTATITVTAVNDAPVLVAIAPTLNAITEDATANAGQTVATILGASVTDIDTGAVSGIAITALASGSGTWQYNTGAGWNNVGVVSNASSLLLRSTDSIRFVPNAENADVATFTYRAWDRTSGATGTKVNTGVNGGTTAFSSVTDTASITVTSLNDAPVLTATSPSLIALTEDAMANAGQSVASFLGMSVTDVDNGAVSGIAITSLNSGNGTWQYDVGSGWTNIGVVSATSALLLRSTDTIRFVPDGGNATTGTLTYRAWDQTSGVAGNKVDASTTGGTSAFSVATDTATVLVGSLNDAPVLTPMAPALNAIDEDATAPAGQTVASFLGASVTDTDTGAVQGVAITSLVSGQGTWQYNIGAGWVNVGVVSATSSLLLRSTDSVRFIPDGENADSVSLTYRAWDRTSGAAGSKVDASTTTGGTSAFSTATDTATLAVTAVNDAPVLAAAAPTLTSVTEDDTAHAGQTVA
ncbi:MAG: DUF4347 domain-containing protein, partial [Magnetococcales bacterium]|nr:DUF4347 domain-containing protein [Magnetococcales bacterium]